MHLHGRGIPIATGRVHPSRRVARRVTPVHAVLQGGRRRHQEREHDILVTCVDRSCTPFLDDSAKFAAGSCETAGSFVRATSDQANLARRLLQRRA
jgi:hypothetical protein